MKLAPHCDSRILHAPKECIFCDKRHDLQKAREEMGINFTGHKDKEKGPCPADFIRGKDHQDWSGNRAYKSEEEFNQSIPILGMRRKMDD